MGNNFSFTNLKGNHYHEIIPNLYIGDANSIYESFFYDQPKLIVINATPSVKFNNKLPSQKNYRISVEDDLTIFSNKKLLKVLHNITDIIAHYLDNGYKVLVHCVAGRQRSCAIVAAYLMKYKKTDFKHSIYIIKSKRPFAFFCNINFKPALISFQRSLTTSA